MRIGIDVDGVVADNHTAWLNRYNKLYSTKWAPDDLTQWEMWLDLGCKPEQLFELWTPDIYTEILPYPGALEAVKALAKQGHELAFITSCRGMPEYNAKSEWLHRHGFIWPEMSIFPVGFEGAYYQTKEAVAMEEKWDILIDDHVPHVEAWPGMAYLMTRPHNRRVITPRKRVKSLMDVVALLKHRKPEVGDVLVVTKAEIAPEGHTIAREQVVGKAGSLPTEWQARKDTPIVRGLLDYFPNAAAEVARISAAGNKQHFTAGTPLHWDFAKSADHADSCVRHMMDRGTIDTDGTRHTAKAAWRALAELETELIAAGAAPGRAVKMPEVG